MKTNSSILILFILLVFSACNKDDNDSPSDPLYPTAIERLNSIDYQNKLTAYKSKNPYLQSDLNQFGFSDVTDNYTELPAPPNNRFITRQEAYAIVRSFIDLNKQETGIADTTQLRFSGFRQITAAEGHIITFLQTQEQPVDSLVVSFTTVAFRLENDQVVECNNNWFPNVYIPKEFFVSRDQAITDLIGEEYSLPTMSGSITGKVVESDLVGATTKTIIRQYPQSVSSTTSNMVELRIAYKIYLPAIFTIFYSDVMDSKILGSESTIISK
jgi:hypothetical protein